MTDISAPIDPGPSSPGEVPINPNPVSTPAPIGSQAPTAPEGEGSKDRPTSRREAIARAFKRAEEPGPAKPRMGHNNPPEETAKEAQTPPKKAKDAPGEEVDLKRRPGDQPRDHGRFAPRAAPEAGAPSSERQVSGSNKAANLLPAHEPYREPPARMAEHAKAEWHTAPQSVRGEIHRMHKEFSEAYQNLKADRDEMEQIREFHHMAREHGTTLHRALTNYTTMERKLRADPLAGIDQIVHNLNLVTSDGQRLGLRDIAYYVLSQTPEQLKMLQNQNAQSAQGSQIGQLHQVVNTLAQSVQQMQYERTYSYTRSEVDRFADTHPRFDELGDLIERELQLGFDLETAYGRANMLRPTHAAQTRTPSAQTRPTTDRSISGGPDGPAPAHRGKPVGRREAIANAIKRVNGSL